MNAVHNIGDPAVHITAIVSELPLRAVATGELPT
jgi:hypothetical protein